MLNQDKHKLGKNFKHTHKHIHTHINTCFGKKIQAHLIKNSK